MPYFSDDGEPSGIFEKAIAIDWDFKSPRCSEFNLQPKWRAGITKRNSEKRRFRLFVEWKFISEGLDDDGKDFFPEHQSQRLFLVAHDMH